jgi:hypothetical protein
MKLPDLQAMYADMAKNAHLSGRLECDVCHCAQPCTEQDSAGYLARGWPKCCGQTMRFYAWGKEPTR